MQLRTLTFKGFLEEQSSQTAEEIQIVVPENDTEIQFLQWAILPLAEAVENDGARQGYVFHYSLNKYLDGGIYSLRIRCRDASGVAHEMEIAAALVATLGTPEGQLSFTPYWFLSEKLHFRPGRGARMEQHHRPAFGRLRFGASSNLPHRRLFGATV